MSDTPVEAWLNTPETEKDIRLVKRNFPDVSAFQAACFVLGIHFLVALEMAAGGEDPGPSEPPEPMPLDFDDEEPDEPWKGKR